MLKTLYLIRGISGSGKSTLASALTEYAIASDDMPGLYQNGTYQVELQAQSHQWCFQTIEGWMQQGKDRLAVANTFVKQKYFQSYIDVAAKYGYAIQIIHCEGVLLPSGNQTSSIHNLPEEVLQRQRDNWEPWQLNPSTQLQEDKL
ncbi:ATP-binding protein [Funiculus sociatus GB2-A5]|uniref:ATP-binding protein n=1 Tax=Funiculus sociatus GB2-A5 TaxID=2933946 RepID=A0ABV0JUE6_9CYAN|nr:AAA family ATPase [Trichocoleus sp. FACHB-6]MBD2060730.1 AAA family ATPase [Trichocoleus sp. FACHB-6]